MTQLEILRVLAVSRRVYLPHSPRRRDVKAAAITQRSVEFRHYRPFVGNDSEAYHAFKMKTAWVLILAVPFFFGSLIQDNSCGSRRNSQSTASSSPSPSASVVKKNDAATPGTQSTSSPNRLSPGIWGGNNANLEVSDGQSSLEFDCARGTISEPIVVDSDGHFKVHGFYMREGPGPERQGGNSQSPATYSGVVKTDTMTLSIRLDGSSDELLNVTLTQGKQGRLRKCY